MCWPVVIRFLQYYNIYFCYGYDSISFNLIIVYKWPVIIKPTFSLFFWNGLKVSDSELHKATFLLFRSVAFWHLSLCTWKYTLGPFARTFYIVYQREFLQLLQIEILLQPKHLLGPYVDIMYIPLENIFNIFNFQIFNVTTRQKWNLAHVTYLS